MPSVVRPVRIAAAVAPIPGMATFDIPGAAFTPEAAFVPPAEPVDVVRYVRLIEEALISFCGELGLTTGRVDGRSGVWLAAGPVRGVWQPERKVAAIGVRVQRGVALHGFSLNCDASLDGFGAIVPCGIPDAGVTSLSAELGCDVPVAAVLDRVEEAMRAVLAGAPATAG